MTIESEYLNLIQDGSLSEPAWTAEDELSYEIGFDRPIFVEPVVDTTKLSKIPPKPVEKPLAIPPTKQVPAERKHITRTGK